MMYVSSLISPSSLHTEHFIPPLRYVSVYPIALSVRSSNVYEERSLGIEEDTDSSIEREPSTKVWGSYLAWHARRQLAFGEYDFPRCYVGEGEGTDEE